MSTTAASESRAVVAILVLNEDHLCLVRRSRHVGSDVGLWHCVTGYLEPDTLPVAQGRCELAEELGVDDARLLGSTRFTLDGWTIHALAVEVPGREVTLNWEHDDYCWVPLDEAMDKPVVWWLAHVIDHLRDAMPVVAGARAAS